MTFTVCARVGETKINELDVSLWHNAEDISSYKALDLSEITLDDASVNHLKPQNLGMMLMQYIAACGQ